MYKKILFVFAFLFSTEVLANPIIYNSVSIPVNSTAYQSKWNSVRFSNLQKVPSFKSGNDYSKIEAVNKWVNNKIRYRNDIGDTWQSATATLSRGYGDCEDYAILKYHLLKKLGFKENQLFLVIGNNVDVRQIHSVLVVKIGSDFFVLDNLTNVVIQSKTDNGFKPMVSMNRNGSWIHGYRKG